MTTGQVLTVFHNAILAMLKLSVPFLVVSTAIGLVIAIFEAATQIHEQTITFVPKIIVIALMMLMLGSWMMSIMNDLFHSIFEMILRL